MFFSFLLMFLSLKMMLDIFKWKNLLKNNFMKL
jgi:hypothetical protein